MWNRPDTKDFPPNDQLRMPGLFRRGAIMGLANAAGKRRISR